MSEMIKDQETSSEQGNAGRRRLVRGAVAFAPLVLTLRSGALAAASCTGAKVLEVTANGSGQFEAPVGSGVIQGDYCVANTQVCGPERPTKIISSGTVDTNIITGPGTNGKFQCGNSRGQTVAILSSTSAHSLTGG